MPPPWLRSALYSFIMAVIYLQGISAQSTCAFMTETSFDLKSVPNEPISPTNLTVCHPSKSSTCCTSDIEAQMKKAAKDEIENAVQDQIILVRRQLQHFGQLFKGHFRAALNVTRARLDRLFAKSYGPFYLQHREMFDDFFNELDTYYTSPYSHISVTDIIDRLFKRLFITMFTLMNPLKLPGTFEKECMAKQMEIIKPFGGYPSKMHKHVERAFTSWKFVGKAMDRGVAELLELLTFKISDECVSGLTKMRHCHVCSGVSPITKPCPGFCLNVLKGCFAGMAEIDPQWNNYLQGLVKNSERLGEVFNPRHVFAPVPVQISEAVMNYQEKGAIISNRVIAACFNNDNDLKQLAEENNNEIEERKESEDLSSFYGVFASLRGKRSIVNKKNDLEKAVYYSNELHLDSYESASSSQEAKNGKDSQTETSDDASETVQQFIDMLTRMKHFFRHLSSTLCTDRKIAAPRGDPICWNGQHLGRYTRRVVGDGIASQRSNPEFVFVEQTQGSRDGYINVLPAHLRPTTGNTHLSQRLTFAALSEKLDALYRGQLSKEMEDYAEEDFDGSGNFINPDDEDNYVIGSGLPPEDVDREHEAVEEAANKAHQDALDDYNDRFNGNFNEIDSNMVAAEHLPVGFVTMNSHRSCLNLAIWMVMVAFGLRFL
uniref:Glypican-6 n=1 Tax=Panagrellus redivivus TaxID=6233 RepID=A0A7E4ZQ37_PANRE